MCMGEAAGDTLRRSEQQDIANVAAAELPGYGVAFCSNGAAMTWVVLEPLAKSASHLRFTICRVAPCLVVMVEEQDADRRFISAATIADAMETVRSADENHRAVARRTRLLH